MRKWTLTSHDEPANNGDDEEYNTSYFIKGPDGEEIAYNFYASHENALLMTAAPQLLHALKVFVSSRNPAHGGWTISAGKENERKEANLLYAERLAKEVISLAEGDTNV